jgi:hypothetical protein
MATTKAKPKPKAKTSAPSSAKWTNQVFRTRDGRLLVRGVDVPAGAEWDRVVSGKAKAHSVASPASSKGRELATVTDKSKALAIARKAGLVLKEVKAQKR